MSGEPEESVPSIEPTSEGCPDECLSAGYSEPGRPDNFIPWMLTCAIVGIAALIASLTICSYCNVHKISKKRKKTASQAKWCRSSNIKFADTPENGNHVGCKTSKGNRIYSDHLSRTLFNDAEAEVLSEMEVHPYRTKYVLMMCMPSLFSIIFMPISIVVYQPLVELLWPPENFAKPPVINEVISSFLVPAGLVYATSFGFFLQEAFANQQSFKAWITVYYMSMKQIIISLGHLRNAGVRTNMKMVHLMKRNFIKCCCAITRWKKNQDEFDSSCAESLFEMLSILHKDVYRIESRTDLQHTSCALHNRLVEMVLALQKHVGQMDIGHRDMTLFEWIFLESVGYFSYFGILLLQAESYIFEMLMCFITILTISLFSYILADLHYPCHGFFKISLDPMFSVGDLLQITFSNIKKSHEDARAEDADDESENMMDELVTDIGSIHYVKYVVDDAIQNNI